MTLTEPERAILQHIGGGTGRVFPVALDHLSPLELLRMGQFARERCSRWVFVSSNPWPRSRDWMLRVLFQNFKPLTVAELPNGREAYLTWGALS